jgi:hypothetical protein
MYASLPFDAAVAGRVNAARGPCHTEVQDTRDAVGTDEHVLGTDVAVNDLQRLATVVGRLVGGVEPVQDAADDRGYNVGRDRLFLRVRRAQEARERLARDVVHHEEELSVPGDDVDRGDDVGVPDSRGHPRLVEKHRHELRVLGVRRVQALDRHGPRETGGAHQPTAVHRRRPARADFIVEGVAADDMRN